MSRVVVLVVMVVMVVVPITFSCLEVLHFLMVAGGIVAMRTCCCVSLLLWGHISMGTRVWR